TRHLENGYTLLYSASFQPTAETCRVLLEAGADPLAPMPETGMTPLHPAASNGVLENIKVLAEYATDLNRESTFGYTPLDVAVISREVEGLSEVAPYLIAQGARVDMFPAAVLGDLE